MTATSAQAYFEEDVPGSQIESKRVRKCMLYYYLEDDCLQIFEPAEENSGLPQGCLVRRHRVPKPDGLLRDGVTCRSARSSMSTKK